MKNESHKTTCVVNPSIITGLWEVRDNWGNHYDSSRDKAKMEARARALNGEQAKHSNADFAIKDDGSLRLRVDEK